jgi:hypothetical protein
MRALSVEELGFVSGGFLSGSTLPREVEVVIVTARRLVDHTLDNMRVQSAFQQADEHKSRVCAMMRGVVSGAEFWQKAAAAGITVSGLGFAYAAVAALPGITLPAAAAVASGAAVVGVVSTTVMGGMLLTDGVFGMAADAYGCPPE